jgi:hypothetical protein
VREEGKIVRKTNRAIRKAKSFSVKPLLASVCHQGEASSWDKLWKPRPIKPEIGEEIKPASVLVTIAVQRAGRTGPKSGQVQYKRYKRRSREKRRTERLVLNGLTSERDRLGGSISGSVTRSIRDVERGRFAIWPNEVE